MARRATAESSTISTRILRSALFIIGRRTVALVEAQGSMVPEVADVHQPLVNPLLNRLQAVAGAKQAF